MNTSLEQHYLDDAIISFRKYKELGDRTFAQLSEEHFHYKLDEESNSIAVIIRHMSGNMISRWTDFLTSDGEKPDRNRDAEFDEQDAPGKDALIEVWEKGWNVLFTTLSELRPGDFEKKVLIRHEEHSIVEAVNRQLTHYAYHVGQIVFLGKHLRSSEWTSLSVPRNRSHDFNREMQQKFAR